MGEDLRLTVDMGLSAITWLGLVVVLMVGASLVYQGDRSAHHLQSAVAAAAALVLPRRQVGGAHRRAVDRGRDPRLGAGAGRDDARPWRMVAGDRAGGRDGGPRTRGAVRDRGHVLGALDAGAVGALYAGPVPRGQWTDDLRRFALQAPGGLRVLLQGAADLLPNLSLFNMRSLASLGDCTTPAHLAVACGYAALYCGCILLLGAAAFESRDFK
jgi:hypothetical protein